MIPEDRKLILNELKNYVQSINSPKINFICTHNSRRSHLSQIWAQTLADHFEIKIETFSGGTEATAFHPNAVAAVERAGFLVEKKGTHNPKYEVQVDDDGKPMVCFSKKFDQHPNPTSEFVAVMTCSEADTECPIVHGADKRIKLFYEDPKVSDRTPAESITYDARCKQIATEMYYVFSYLK